jgi:signal transduction histidine kinase
MFEYTETESSTYSSHGESEAINGSLSELSLTLKERVKELNCLYEMSHLLENEKLSIDEMLQGVIDIIPTAWQYPKITCARIKCKKKIFASSNFRETEWKQSRNIIVNGKRFGTIEVCYLEEKPASYEGPFLKEEKNLLYIIAERIGHAVERNMAEKNVEFLYKRERELREKLQNQMKIRADFTRRLIHELKTPLTALIATSQLLHDETEEQKLKKLAKYILDSAENLNKRIDELRDLIRGEIGVLNLVLKKVNLEGLLITITEEIKPLCDQMGIDIKLHLENELPEIKGDDERIRQIVLNLINNALKYARDGKNIMIFASPVEDMVQIEVRDFGPGIAAEKQNFIFEPGYQLSQNESPTGGFGIGLALCKTLVDLHGGKIWLQSKQGKGTSFFFTLPIYKR